MSAQFLLSAAHRLRRNLGTLVCVVVMIFSQPLYARDTLPPADASQGELPPNVITRLGTTRLRHGKAVLAVGFTNEDNLLVSASADGTICTWDISTGRLLKKIFASDAPLGLAIVSREGNLVATVQARAEVSIWNSKTGTKDRVLDIPCQEMSSLAFNRNNSLLACGGLDGSIYVQDLTSSWAPHLMPGKRPSISARR